MITEAEAEYFGEELVQLLEGGTYDYHVVDAAELHVRAVPSVVRPSAISKNTGDHGTITPGLHTGRLALHLDNNGREVAVGYLEVRSTKLGYRAEYRRMLDDIAKRSTDLLLRMGAPAELRLEVSAHALAESLQQQFMFVKSVLASREFQDAIRLILNRPHVRLTPTYTEQPLGRSTRPSRRLVRELASRRPRARIPQLHPLHALLKQGDTEPTIPLRVRSITHEETNDTPENRFVKHTLVTFESLLHRLEQLLLARPYKKVSFVKSEIRPLRTLLSGFLRDGFFSGLSPLGLMPLASPVLQRKEGYREVLKAWVRFHLAAQLTWRGGKEVYGGAKKDVAQLYEYWVFFVLAEIVDRVFELEQPLEDWMIERSADGLYLKVRAGMHRSVSGTCRGGGRPVKVRFSYNRSFSRPGDDKSQNYPHAGSWTRPMRPDFSLTFWPASMTLPVAETQELAVHVHFDAKYRIVSVNELFGTPAPNLDADRRQEKKGNVKRVDLLKMHAYKDAIRRSEGAYVIYPGHEHHVWQEFRELVPGLGAFALAPTAEGPRGCDAIEKFLCGLVEHVSDRATARERVTYHRRQAMRGGPTHSVRVAYPETDIYGERGRPPAEEVVAMVLCDGSAHKTWILEQHNVDVELAGMLIPKDLLNSGYVLLLDREHREAEGILRVTASAAKLVTTDDLRDMGRPNLQGGESIHVLLNVEEADDFIGSSWDEAVLGSLGADFTSPLSGFTDFCSILGSLSD